jgi:hypothetical protein
MGLGKAGGARGRKGERWGLGRLGERGKEGREKELGKAGGRGAGTKGS